MAAPTASTPIDIQQQGAAFLISGWRPPPEPAGHDWSGLFAVYAGSGDTPLLGSYAVEAGRLVFRPSYPITAGLQYRAVFQLPGARPVERVFQGPPLARTPSTRVLRVYPSIDVLPSNQLRLYIYFSAPMSRGEVATYLHILDAQGRVLRDVFLPGEELWDPDYQRLTMTFDPGRIKRGLTSNMNLGPPIAPGQHYTLSIDGAWQDARGVPLVAPYTKSFVGGPALRTPPDPSQWHLAAPRAGTAGPLTVEFPTPMNYPLLQRMLLVRVAGRSVAGTVSIEGQETRWRFMPLKPWASGDYQLVVDRGLEDLAGNKIGQPFDIDVFQRVTEHIVTQSVTVPFAVRP